MQVLPSAARGQDCRKWGPWGSPRRQVILRNTVGMRSTNDRGPGFLKDDRALGDVARTPVAGVDLISKVSAQPLQESLAGGRSHRS